MKRFLILLLLIFPLFLSAQEKIVVGIASPFIEQENAATIFYHKQFQFELLSRFNSDQYSVEMLRSVDNDDYPAHIREMKLQVINTGYDYLIYGHIYMIGDKMVFNAELVNPYTDQVLYSWLFTEATGFSINESLTNNTEKILTTLYALQLTRIKSKLTIEKPEENDDPLKEVKGEYKHEIFMLNGFLKNHSGVMSFLSWYMGYNFSPYDFLRVEAGFFVGTGYPLSLFNFDNFRLDQPYIGGYAGLYIYFKGIFEPTIGIRLEFSYIFNHEAYLSIPVDIGFRIYVDPKNAIRIGSSFQFTTFSFHGLEWRNQFTTGVLLGYVRKL